MVCQSHAMNYETETYIYIHLSILHANKNGPHSHFQRTQMEAHVPAKTQTRNSLVRFFFFFFE